MTNETTASQPMQELVRDLYNFQGGIHFALRLEKILASQPKSIGDDAQFQNWLVNYTMAVRAGEDGVKSCDELVAYIHAYFRAPAAQASATIQAAPEGYRYVLLPVDTTEAMVQAGIDSGKSKPFSYASCFRAMLAAAPAATIQEPVMVAEPVGGTLDLDHLEKLANSADTIYTSEGLAAFQRAFTGGVALQLIALAKTSNVKHPEGSALKVFNTFWSEHESVSLEPKELASLAFDAGHKLRHETSLAAPMVADPAGVARQALIDLRALHIGTLSKPSHFNAYLDIIDKALAATVKAVPKIRITLRQARRLVDFFGGHDADVTVTERPADWEQVEEGLYAFCTEYPEDGAQFLGATETDDELMLLGTVKAVPSEALDADGRIAELEGLLQVAAQGLRFRAKDNNGDEALKPIWEYMVKHHPEYDGRLSGWASMRPNWQSTDSGHAYGCQCAACKAKRSGAAPLADKTGGGE